MPHMSDSEINLPKRRLRLAPEARVPLILDAALEEFSRRGFSAARMDDIAQRCGLSKGGLYAHFDSKDAIFKALLDRTLHRTDWARMPQLAAGAGTRAVAEWIVDHLRAALLAPDVEWVVLLNNDVTLRELLNKAPIARRGLPTLMIPTTAGTGSETTPNSIVLVPEDELKVGIVSPKLLPDCVILDPKMTLGLPPAITASTGMDALCHAIECYTSKKGNPFSEMIALKAISLISRSIRRAFNTGTDIDARHDMLLGAMYGGMCIATSSTTAVHALAYPLGGKYRIAHGVSNAILLPFVMRFNAVGNEDKFRDVAVAMDLDVDPADSKAATEKFIEAIFELNRDLQIPSDLKRWNITEADLDTLVEGAAKVTRLLDNNPRPMNKADIRAIYTQLI